MTIPIEPGPFSFLAGAGEALGAYASEREKKRQQQLKEAKDQLNQMIDLRSKGLIDPGAFGSEQARRLYQIIGIEPISTAPTSAESVEKGKRSYLGQLAPQLGGPPDQMSDEARAVIGAPERGLTERITAGVEQNKAAVPIAQASVAPKQLESLQATAAMPEAGPTAIAGQQTEQSKAFNDIADNVVSTLYSRTKKLPTPEAAFSAGRSNPQARAFGDRISPDTYGAAIERLRAKLAGETTARMGAEARARGAAGTGLDDFLRIQQGQQTRIVAELNALNKPLDSDFRSADIAAQMAAKGKPVPSFIASAAARVTEYNRRKSELEQQLQQSREQLDRLLGGATGTPGATPPGTSGGPQNRAAATEYEQRVKGITDPAERKKIAEEIARKYNIAPQTQRRF